MTTATKPKAKRVRPPRAKRPKQSFIPGMEPPSNRAVDTAADDYVETRDERMKLSKEEKRSKQNLIEKMVEAGLDAYETPHGLIVLLLSDKDVKVKTKKQVDRNGDESGEE